jgi:hypothetical protein
MYATDVVGNQLTSRSGGQRPGAAASNAIDREFESRSGQTKDYTIGINCFLSAKHAALRRKSKDWLPRNQDNLKRAITVNSKNHETRN